MKHYATITEVINEYVVPALGTYVDDYDVEAIARDIMVCHPRYMTVNEDAFWSSVEAHAIATD